MPPMLFSSLYLTRAAMFVACVLLGIKALVA